jgi:septum formation protein
MIISPFLNWPDDEILILASQSPRRAELLEIAGIPFEIIPTANVEDKNSDKASILNPADYAELQASAKAKAIASQYRNRIVLGADTIVVLDEDILEKPLNRLNAFEMLQSLAGRQHTVVSAIAIVKNDYIWTGHSSTNVEFLPLGKDEINRYIDTGEPMDKAGSYGIQGYGAMMIKQIEGCYFNVMGLPISLLGEALNSRFLDK